MGRRREQRATINLPVKISGRDLDNHPFTQACETVDISRNGCQVRWIACLRGPGDTVEVQYQKEKARFKVLWIGKEGTRKEAHVGLRALENKYIWGVALPGPKLDDYTISEEEAPPPPPEPVVPVPVSFEPTWRGDDRRSDARFRCSGEVDAVDPKTDTKVRGMLSDISLGGCYVDMVAPLASDIPVRVLITAAGARIETPAIVRASHPSMGMGLEFTEMSPENRERLQALVDQLAGRAAQQAAVPVATPEASRYELSESDFEAAPAAPPPQPVAAAPLPLPPQTFDSELVLETLLQLLHTKGILTREEFLRALEKTASTTRRE